jgi:hypothetical protein
MHSELYMVIQLYSKRSPTNGDALLWVFAQKVDEDGSVMLERGRPIPPEHYAITHFSQPFFWFIEEVWLPIIMIIITILFLLCFFL